MNNWSIAITTPRFVTPLECSKPGKRCKSAHILSGQWLNMKCRRPINGKYMRELLFQVHWDGQLVRPNEIT